MDQPEAPFYTEEDGFKARLSECGWNLSELSRQTGIPRPTLQHYVRKYKIKLSRVRGDLRTPSHTGMGGLGSPGHSRSANGEVTATLPEHPKRDGMRTEDEVLEDHGLDPEKWRVKSYNDNYWKGNDGSGPQYLTQSKVVAVPAIDLSALNLNIEDGWTPPAPKPRVRSLSKPMYIPMFMDPHFPFHEPALYEGSLAWLAEHEQRIKEILCPGDEGDWTPFSRHRKNRRFDISVGQAVRGTYEGLAGWRNAAPGVPIKILPGNHTHWLQSRLLEVFPQAAELRRPGEDYDLLSLRSVLNLDQLRIEYLDTLGEYHDVFYEVAPGLVAMHGTFTGKTGGAIKEIRAWEGTSIAQGHDHAGALIVVNFRLPDGTYVQRYAISGMAMCQRDVGGYSSKADVAQGFPVITVWPDGRWHPDFALFDPQTQETTHRDWRYKP